jgi:hypothetical protein
VRFFLFCLIATSVMVLVPSMAQAQEPPITTTVTGQFSDQDPLTGQPVTRSITLTLEYPARYPYTYTELSCCEGFVFILEQTATLGDVVSGIGPCLLLVAFLLWLMVRLAWRRRV